MNRAIYVQCIRLVGKLVQQYGIDPNDYDGSDKELIEQAIRDNAFYATTEEAHRNVQAGGKRKPGRPPKGN